MIAFNFEQNTHSYPGQQDTTPVLEQALLVSRQSGRRFVTRHDITKGKMGVGSLLNNNDIENLLCALRDGRVATGRTITPSNVLFHSDDSAAWLIPGSVRPMYFRLPHERKLNVPWPTLVVMTIRGTTWVAALKNADRDPDQPVFHAPLMNVYHDGRVCHPQGTAIPDGLQSISAAEDMLFKSAFSHANHQQPITPEARRSKQPHSDATTELDRFYLSLKGKVSHPTRRWVPTGLSLQKWLSTR